MPSMESMPQENLEKKQEASIENKFEKEFESSVFSSEMHEEAPVKYLSQHIFRVCDLFAEREEGGMNRLMPEDNLRGLHGLSKRLNDIAEGGNDTVDDLITCIRHMEQCFESIENLSRGNELHDSPENLSEIAGNIRMAGLECGQILSSMRESNKKASWMNGVYEAVSALRDVIDDKEQYIARRRDRVADVYN